MYEKELIQAGLTEKQAKVYFACLELGNSGVPEIGKRAGIKRTTAYGILDELINLGLVGSSNKGRVKRFKAQKPDSILALLEKRKKSFEKVAPELMEIFSKHKLKPSIQFFEGIEGVKRIYEDTLGTKEKEILQIVKVKDFISFPSKDYSKKYIENRVKRGVSVKAIHPKSGDIYDNIYGTKSEKFLRQVRYLPPSMFYASMIMIYDDKVSMISTKEENFGFIIESKEFSNTLRAYFSFMWNIGSKEPEV